MNHFKQNIWVVSILFFSLVSSVALSYAITPTSKTVTETKPVIKKLEVNQTQKEFNESSTIVSSPVVK